MPMIEGYMFEEHEMIRRAATECMSNMAMSKEVGMGSSSLTQLPPRPGAKKFWGLGEPVLGGWASPDRLCPSLCSGPGPF